MILKPADLSRTEISQAMSQIVFRLRWTPEIPNVGGAALFHKVKSTVDSLFLGNKPLVDFHCASTFLVIVWSSLIVD
jgi:hypothetical protein